MKKEITVKVTLTHEMLEAVTAYAYATQELDTLSDRAIRNEILHDIRKDYGDGMHAILATLWQNAKPALKQHERSARLLSTKGDSCVQIGQANALWAETLLAAAQ